MSEHGYRNVPLLSISERLFPALPFFFSIFFFCMINILHALRVGFRSRPGILAICGCILSLQRFRLKQYTPHHPSRLKEAGVVFSSSSLAFFQLALMVIST